MESLTVHFLYIWFMPAIKVITPILGDRYYHIFNRGNSGQQVFFTEENYRYFLKLYRQFMYPCVDLLAYSLMPNHFHFLVKTKDSFSNIKDGIPESLKDEMDPIPQKKDGILTDGILTDESLIGKIVSNQFRRFFITYSMAINHQENRTGSLFSKNFKRLEIEDEDYLRYLAFYIHYNPQNHAYVDDFRKYRYSSWNAYDSKKATLLNRELLTELFGGIDELLEYHKYLHEEKELNLLE